MAAARPASDIEFWQRILAAEIPAAKLKDLMSKAEECPSEAEAIRFVAASAALSSGERERFLSASPTPANAALDGGAELVLAGELDGRLPEFVPGIPALFMKGDSSALERKRVAIVGTRGASTYGKACAIKFSEHLASAGVSIISGAAFGIDAAAHRAALQARGKTIAVLPCGIDRVYPPSHADLYKKIASNGMLVSQFACGFMPRSDTFLHRNYLIAALCDAVLVVEAPERSGALHSANRAAEFGKPVYVVPASITDGNFRGSFELIRSGATLVYHPDQILEDLGVECQEQASAAVPENELQRSILLALTSEPVAIEKLADVTNAEPGTLMAELTMLELEGKILRGPGGVSLAP